MLHLSLIAVLFLFILIQMIRLLAQKLFKSEQRLYAEEFLLNVQCSACVMELGVIGTIYGSHSLVLYASLFFFLLVKFHIVLHGGLVASPLAFIGRYYSDGRKRDFAFLTILLVTCSQIIGCLVGQYIMKFMWSYMSGYHIDARHIVCTSTLSSSAMIGAVAEGGGVFVGVLVSRLVPAYLNPLSGAVLTVLLLPKFGHYTGLWMNPMLASAHTFRCKGHTSDWQHVMVYWIGPILGAFIANELSELVAKFYKKRKID